jgi:apolipoprotein D and lipocalin family protein
MTGRLLVALCVLAAALYMSIVPEDASASDASKQDEERPVTTVKAIDLKRYVGLWYEIAKIPNRFQKQCVRGTTAEYTLREDGRISVVNQCFKKDGSLDDAKGIAKVIDTTSNAKLKVSFVSFLGWRPFWGDYWVIGLDEGYEWAVVGTPDKKYGWVLARTPALDENTMEEIRTIIEHNGYKWDAFELSPQ